MVAPVLGRTFVSEGSDAGPGITGFLDIELWFCLGAQHMPSAGLTVLSFLNTALLLDALMAPCLAQARLPLGSGGRSLVLGARSCRSLPGRLQHSSMEAATSSKHLHSLTAAKGKKQKIGSLEAAVSQCLSLGMTCMAGANPSWVMVQGASTKACVLHYRDIPSSVPTLGCAGLIPMNSVALCWLLAILSSWRALLVDFLGADAGQNSHLPPAQLSCSVC